MREIEYIGHVDKDAPGFDMSFLDYDAKMYEDDLYPGVSIFDEAMKAHGRKLEYEVMKQFLELPGNTLTLKRSSLARRGLERFCRWLMDRLGIREEW